MPSDPFFKSRRWFAIRDRIIRRDGSRCKNCGRFLRAKGDRHVDHVISRAKRPDLAYVERNLQLLCRGCHTRKTNAVDGGANGVVNENYVSPTCDEGGMPLDRGHPWFDGGDD